MHETELTYDKTQQVARERQRVELSSEGLYDIQVLSLTLNTAEVDLDDPPAFVVEWGGRESDVFTFQQLHEDTGEELAARAERELVVGWGRGGAISTRIFNYIIVCKHTAITSKLAVFQLSLNFTAFSF